MSDESFLAAIDASPQDRTPRLVYADWLEERGDPRGELIRVEEEMRSVPIYADRYWEFKPRRNELREGCDPEWLRHLRYGTDYEPVFREVPEDWQGRWRLIRELLERWYGIPLGDVGGHRNEVRLREGRLSFRLPPGMKEWIALYADLRPKSSRGGRPSYQSERMSAWAKVFRDNFHVQHLQDLAAVSLMLQWERDLYYAVRTEHLHVEDPPVDVYGLATGSGLGSRFVHRGLIFPQVTTFAFYHINFRLTQGVSTGCLRSPLRSQRDGLELANAAFPVRSRFGEVRFFETTNLLAWVERDYLLVKAARPLSRPEFPACLREYIPESGSFREMVIQWPRGS
jgi:uncharacterized protein (TIGR02996 family)